jgi:cytochrome c oxidase assembly protein subunit 15
VLLMGGAVLLQYGLGIITLLHVVPWSLGTLHQAVAVLVLTTGLLALLAESRCEQLPLPSSWEREGPFLVASLHRIGLQTKHLGW